MFRLPLGVGWLLPLVIIFGWCWVISERGWLGFVKIDVGFLELKGSLVDVVVFGRRDEELFCALVAR